MWNIVNKILSLKKMKKRSRLHIMKKMNKIKNKVKRKKKTKIAVPILRKKRTDLVVALPLSLWKYHPRVDSRDSQRN